MAKAWKVSWQMLFLAASIPSSGCLFIQAQGKKTTHIIVQPETLREGESVSLTPGGVNLFSFTECYWYRGVAERKNKIFGYLARPFIEQENGPSFSGRETGATDCSLHITDLRLSDSGTYTFKMKGVLHKEMGTTSITISEILSSAVLRPAKSLVAENSTVTLHCNTSDRLDVSVFWFKGGYPVPTKAGLSERNRTMTLTGLTKEDGGIYTCQAVNPVSSTISNPSIITVAYSSPPSSAGAQAGTVIGSLSMILVLMGILTYVFLRVCHRNGKTLVVSTPQAYENILPSGQITPEVKPESSSEANNTYQALQPRIESIYEEIKR